MNIAEGFSLLEENTLRDRAKFQLKALRKMNITMRELCKECPHQRDTHQMNCIECCPISRIINHKAGLGGKVVIHSDTMRVMYTDWILDDELRKFEDR